MRRFLKRLFCRHTHLVHYMNLYGDQIIAHGWKRSMWKCRNCGAMRYKDYLHNPAQEPRPTRDTWQ